MSSRGRLLPACCGARWARRPRWPTGSLSGAGPPWRGGCPPASCARRSRRRPGSCSRPLVLPFVLEVGVADGLTVGLLVIGYALMRRVRFQLGPGLIRPTQLVFVPLLLLTPAPWVPALVALGLAARGAAGRRAAHGAPGAAAREHGGRLVLGRAGAGHRTVRRGRRVAGGRRGVVGRAGGAVRHRSGRVVAARVVRVRDPARRAAAGAGAGLSGRRAAVSARLSRRAGQPTRTSTRICWRSRPAPCWGCWPANAAAGSCASWSWSVRSGALPVRSRRARRTCAGRPVAASGRIGGWARPCPRRRTARRSSRCCSPTVTDAVHADCGRLSAPDGEACRAAAW